MGIYIVRRLLHAIPVLLGVTLVTFVLFGHWMEMRSRRGTSDALRALFDLVPPTARVLRNGVEVELPTTEVLVGDQIRLRPGEQLPLRDLVAAALIQSANDSAVALAEHVGGGDSGSFVAYMNQRA
mgnify:CR=1 FL=1